MLENVSKDKYDSEVVSKFAEEIVYMSNLNATLKELFRSPSDNFLRANFDATNKHLILRLDKEQCEQLCPAFEVDAGPRSTEGSRIYIQSPDDLLQMRDLILAAFDAVQE